MNGGSNKKNKEQENSMSRRVSGFESSLKQEAVMKTHFEDQLEGNKITR